jgi:fucose 4-O-acetylase-like acetyltransferase
MALLFLFLFHMSLLLFLSGYAVFFSIVLEYATRMIGVDVDYSSGN